MAAPLPKSLDDKLDNAMPPTEFPDGGLAAWSVVVGVGHAISVLRDKRLTAASDLLRHLRLFRHHQFVRNLRRHLPRPVSRCVVRCDHNDWRALAST